MMNNLENIKDASIILSGKEKDKYLQYLKNGCRDNMILLDEKKKELEFIESKIYKVSNSLLEWETLKKKYIIIFQIIISKYPFERGSGKGWNNIDYIERLDSIDFDKEVDLVYDKLINIIESNNINSKKQISKYKEKVRKSFFRKIMCKIGLIK